MTAGFLGRFAVLSFVMNWIWETMHASAYLETQGPLLWRAWHCLPMAFVDVAWTLGLHATSLLIARFGRWPAGGFPHLALLTVLGALSAVTLERYAVATQRWSYAPTMPVIPMVDVGLWPVLQMALIPALGAYLAKATAQSGAADDLLASKPIPR